MSTRWQWSGLVVASTLVIVGIALSGPAEHTPGFAVSLASTTSSGTGTTLRYRASVSPADRICPGDYFEVFDLSGYVDGSAAAPAHWSVSTAPVGPSLAPSRGDDPAVPNLVFTYLGPVPIAGPVLLTGFSAVSTTGKPRAVHVYSGRATRATGPAAGSATVSSGEVLNPGAVPEPGSLITGSVGVILLGIVYASRHRQRLHAMA